MKIVVVAAFAALSLGAAATVSKPDPAPVAAKPIQLATAMCTKTGDRVSGSNRICTYKCLGGDEVVTIPATQLCPLSINR